MTEKVSQFPFDECIKKARVFPLSQRFQTRDRRKLTYSKELISCLQNMRKNVEDIVNIVLNYWQPHTPQAARQSKLTPASCLRSTEEATNVEPIHAAHILKTHKLCSHASKARDPLCQTAISESCSLRYDPKF